MTIKVFGFLAILAACQTSIGAGVEDFNASADRITSDQIRTTLEGNVKVTLQDGAILETHATSFEANGETGVTRLQGAVKLKLQHAEIRADRLEIHRQSDGTQVVTSEALTIIRASDGQSARAAQLGVAASRDT